MFNQITYIHALPMAFVGAVKGINFIVQMKRRWRLKWRQLTAEILGLLIQIGGEFIVPDVWIMILAIKLIIIHITLINIQFRYIDIDAQKSS